MLLAYALPWLALPAIDIPSEDNVQPPFMLQHTEDPSQGVALALTSQHPVLLGPTYIYFLLFLFSLINNSQSTAPPGALCRGTALALTFPTPSLVGVFNVIFQQR